MLHALRNNAINGDPSRMDHVRFVLCSYIRFALIKTADRYIPFLLTLPVRLPYDDSFPKFQTSLVKLRGDSTCSSLALGSATLHK